MDNQHKLIKGYRDLAATEINSMNGLKALEHTAGIYLQQIADYSVESEDAGARGRWLALARTHLETGFMFAIKAVALPTNGLGRTL